MTRIPSSSAARSIALLILLSVPLAVSTAADAASLTTGRVSLLGQVTDEAGAPLEGAVVVARAARSEHDQAADQLAGEQPREAARAVTDARGAYRLDVDPGVYELIASAGGKAPRRIELLPIAESFRLEPVALPEAATFRLQVLRPEETGTPTAGAPAAGEPVAGASVAVRSDGSRVATDWHPPIQRARTDESGLATFAVDPGRTVNVWAVAKDGSFFDQVSPDRVAEVTLKPSLECTIQVRDPRGRPLAGVVVSLTHGRIAVGRTNEEGRLSLHFAERSTVPLFLTDADGRYLHTHIAGEVSQGGGSVYPLTLPDPVIVSGRAVAPDNASDSGEGVADAWVWPARFPSQAAPTDRGGGFRLVVRPGVEWVKAVATGYAPGFEILKKESDETVESSSTQGLEISMQPITRIVGRVVDSAGRGIGEADIVAAARLTDAQKSRTRGRSGNVVSAQSRSDGSFVIDRVHPEVTYELEARRAGFAVTRQLVRTVRSPEVAEVELTMEPGIRAFGQVVDELNEPVAGATVELSPPPRTIPPGLTVYSHPEPDIYTGVSGDDGTFVVPDLGEDTYRIDVTRAGFSPTSVPGVEINGDLVVDHEADLGVIVMVPGVELEGRVVDADGRPIAGAELVATPTDHSFRDPMRPKTRLQQTTGPDGGFRFVDLVAEEPLDLEVQHPDYLGVRLEDVQPPLLEPLRIVLERPAVVRGRVVDDFGSPVPGLTVFVRPDSRAPTPRSSEGSYGQTGDAGEFEILQARTGPGKLVVGSDVWRVDEPQTLEIAPGAVIEGVDVRVTRAILLTGTITGPDGRPLDESWLNVELSLSEEGRHSSSSRGLRTDKDGAFQIGDVEPGRWTVSVVHSDYGEARETVTITERGAHVDLEFGGGSDVSGQVLTPDGEPAVRTTVGLYPEPDPGASRHSYSPRMVGVNPDGTFRIPGVQDGTYRLTADHPDFAQYRSEPFVIDSSTAPEQLVELRRGAVVRGEVNGLEFEQLSGAAIEAHSVVGLGRQVPVRHDATYEMKGLAPGTWYFTARAGDDHRSSELVLEEGRSDARLDFDFSAGFELEGRVVVNGDAANGARVGATRVADPRNERRAETNFEGEFRLGGLESGPHFLQVSSGEGLRLHRTVEIPYPGRIEINLWTSTLEGTVRSDDGTPLAGARVVAETQGTSDPADLARQLGERHQAVTDADGRYRLDQLEEGDWQLTATHDGFAQATTTVQTAQGADQTGVDITLRPVLGLWIDLRPAPELPMPKRVAVAVMDSSGAPHAVVAAPVGDDGSVHLSTLPEGSWRLAVAIPPGAAPAVAATVYLDATAPADRPTVPLQPGAMLQVSSTELDFLEGIQMATVTRSDGLVHLPILDGRLLPGWPILGEHRLILGLPGGTWSVEIPLPDGRVLEGTATVQAGETATVEVVP